MSARIEEVRALLAVFARSPWSDLHVRSDGLELFFAKPGGAADPMPGRRAEEVERDDMPLATVHAPHLGLFVAGLPAGARVGPGTVIAQIEVLGAREDIVADAAGRIGAILAEDGALVEYGMPLIRLAA